MAILSEWFKTCDDPRVRRFVDGRATAEDLAVLDVEPGLSEL
jgi:hypothetical protein